MFDYVKTSKTKENGPYVIDRVSGERDGKVYKAITRRSVKQTQDPCVDRAGYSTLIYPVGRPVQFLAQYPIENKFLVIYRYVLFHKGLPTRLGFRAGNDMVMCHVIPKFLLC